jgi:hypothetical protein
MNFENAINKEHRARSFNGVWNKRTVLSSFVVLLNMARPQVCIQRNAYVVTGEGTAANMMVYKSRGQLTRHGPITWGLDVESSRPKVKKGKITK